MNLARHKIANIASGLLIIYIYRIDLTALLY
jgi:hypothetical protein